MVPSIVHGPDPAGSILHIAAELVFGGVENWLLSVARLLTPRGFQMDFAVTGTIDPRVRRKFEALGARVFPCPSTYQPLQVSRNLRRILAAHGPYDILHCHMHRGNAHAALTARLAGVPAILVHSHLNTAAWESGSGWGTRPKTWLASFIQRLCADQGLACSHAAGDCLFDRGWRKRRGWSVHYCGLDLTPFRHPVDRLALRHRLGIPPGAFVIGHVGRFDPVKNHDLILQLAVPFTAAHPDACFVLIGDGDLRPALEQRALHLGLAGRIHFLGARDDVPELLLGLFDAFLLPSLAEGLPISYLEAQAAGLPALISDRIPSEARVLPAVEVLPVSHPPAAWAAALQRLRGQRLQPHAAQALLRQAGFDGEDSVHRLERRYHDLLQRRSRMRNLATPRRAL